tara:strand:+ start:392 stop:1318 length:927 start_codon:yes stop_codon:yes gene_type:complete
MKEHYVLNEKYRPTTLDNYICSDQFKQKVEGWLEDKSVPHLFFYGRAGSGKTTLAKILVKTLDCDYLYVNATDKRGMDDIRNSILPFVSSASFKDVPKIVILDEATHILQASQVLLLNMIETYSANTRFILTGNYPERLIEPLRSRLEDYNLKPPSKKAVAKHVAYILNEEEVEFEIKDLAPIINEFYPDTRRIINTCQKCIMDGELVLDSSLLLSDDYMNLILVELQKKSPTWKSLRQIIVDSESKDFEDLYKFLFKNIEKYSRGKEGSVTIILNESLYQSNFIIDKEINISSCLSRVVEAIKPQVI